MVRYSEFTATRFSSACCGERLFPLTAQSEQIDNEAPMIEVRYAVFCDHALIDQAGKLSVIGIFDAIRPPQLPFNVPTFHLVVGFEAEAAEPQEFRTKYVIVDQDGTALFERTISLRFPDVEPGNMKRYNDLLTLNGMPISSPGPHSFTVYVNDEIRKRVVLDVETPPVVSS